MRGLEVAHWLNRLVDALDREGVSFAGDYTDPEYPPTLEAAVRSGVRAASSVLQLAR